MKKQKIFSGILLSSGCFVLLFLCIFSFPSFSQAEEDILSQEIQVSAFSEELSLGGEKNENNASLEANAFANTSSQNGDTTKNTFFLWAFVVAVVLGSLASKNGKKKSSSPVKSTTISKEYEGDL